MLSTSWVGVGVGGRGLNTLLKYGCDGGDEGAGYVLDALAGVSHTQRTKFKQDTHDTVPLNRKLVAKLTLSP
jgi:hypothetical protein